jgi:hypothetical protein
MQVKKIKEKPLLLLREEFQNWLVKNGIVSVDSSKSYGIYMSSALKKITEIKNQTTPEQDSYFDLIEKAFHNGNEEMLEEAILILFQYLCKEGVEEELECSKKYIQNWRSALLQYGEFLLDWVANSPSEEVQDNEEIQAELEEFSEAIEQADFTYDKKNLYRVFTLRLVTQDRFYNSLFFPISLIKKIFYKRNEKRLFDQCINEMLDHTKVFHQNGFFYLKDIQQIDFANGKVLVQQKDKTFLAYTKMADNNSLSPFTTTQLSKIALDHDKPMYNIITEKANELEVLQIITNEIKKHIGSDKLNRNSLVRVSKIVFENGFVETVSLDALKKELDLIVNETVLQLMDASQNSSKGATYEA